ncbi:nuclear valosin-containing protein-like [Dysidea avara]|uniref:nuclear valosin-containing protein-like n=1 Tax=Dysidea avara TaxID=196820 RepID=UPI00332F1765
MGRRKQFKKNKKIKLGSSRRHSLGAQQHYLSEHGKNKRPNEDVEIACGGEEVDSVKRRRYEDSDLSDSSGSDVALQKAKESNIINSSLMRLYRSPSQSLVTAAVTPILRSGEPSLRAAGGSLGDTMTFNLPDTQGVCDSGQEQLTSSENDQDIMNQGNSAQLTDLPVITDDEAVPNPVESTGSQGKVLSIANQTSNTTVTGAVDLPEQLLDTHEQGSSNDTPKKSSVVNPKSGLDEQQSERAVKKRRSKRPPETAVFTPQKSSVTFKDVGGIEHCIQTNAPCILFLDDIDAICPKRETAQREMERRIVSQLLSCFNDLSNSPPDQHVLVIGATNHLDSLDSALRSAGRFEKEISVGVPNEKARKKILEVLCRDLRLGDGFEHTSLAHATPGFVGGDLSLLVKEAAMVAIRRILKQLEEQRDSNSEQTTAAQDSLLTGTHFTIDSIPPDVSITNEDFKKALTTVQPSAKREGFASVPDVTWDDIGALDHIKEELALCILAPVHHSEHFESLGLTTPTGVLLIGPPGCGKTLLAKAVANESGINFISVKGPELLNMYVGESEKAVRQVFQKARDSAPCVIFFDELDSLCPRRSESREGHSSARVVNQLLTEMDGMESRKQVFVMAATNRPDILDEAVLRPGRLDKTLYIGLPTAEERAVILKTITKRKPSLAPDVDLDAIAKDQLCEGFSGADLSAVVKEAAITALKESLPAVSLLHQKDSKTPFVHTVVKQSHFITAFTKVAPSVSKEDQVRYQRMAKQLSTNIR